MHLMIQKGDVWFVGPPSLLTFLSVRSFQDCFITFSLDFAGISSLVNT